MPWVCREFMTGEPADRQNNVVFPDFEPSVGGNNVKELLDTGLCHCPVCRFILITFGDRYRENGPAILR